MIGLSVDGDNEPVGSIVLIKAGNKDIKRVPEGKGGVNIDNLNISVYDVIDNKKNNDEVKINKTNQNIDMGENLSVQPSEQELLNDKINKINDNDNTNLTSANNAVENIQINKSNASINIKNDDKTSNTNVKELESLGNNSLIKNLQNKKDTKPGVRVQILALRTRDGLEQYWNNLKKKYQDLLADKTYYIEEANLDGAGGIYRLQVGNFKDKNEAEEFCKKYIDATNKNNIDCISI